MEYLNHEVIGPKLQSSPSYQKKAETFLRKPTPEELGSALVTWVKEGASVRQESVNTIHENSIIARNPGSIGTSEQGEIFNEWVVAEDVVAKNYGPEVLKSLTCVFAPFRKSSTIQALLITQDVFDDLGVRGDVLEIDVSWSPEPMKAKIGDYLTSGGYSVSSHDMEKTYVLCEPTPSVPPMNKTRLSGKAVPPERASEKSLRC